jgi:hypothetical protein
MANGERLLAQHRLARFEAGNCVLLVERVRRRDVDRVDVGVGGERLVTRVAVRRAELLAERVGRLLRPRANRDQLGVVQNGQARRELLRDRARPQNAPTQRVNHHRVLVRVISHQSPVISGRSSAISGSQAR